MLNGMPLFGVLKKEKNYVYFITLVIKMYSNQMNPKYL